MTVDRDRQPGAAYDTKPCPPPKPSSDNQNAMVDVQKEQIRASTFRLREIFSFQN
jgi:hypothetical protein